jgi:uncharacterized protein YbjT (DUF2867 family)
VRVATRHPGRIQLSERPDSVVAVRADVRDPASVEAALEGSQAVVNAVGLYVERGTDSFESVHVRGAGNVARVASKCGVDRLVHVSGIGASAASASSYVRARADGESVAQYQFGGASIVRPSVLFGPGDSFLGVIDGISRLSPVFPLFGAGETRMQPVYVDDVAEAVARMLDDPATRATVSELGGPRVYTYREIIEAVLAYRRRRRLLLPVPFSVWTLQAKLLSILPNPPLTEDQVILMRDDNVVAEGVLTFDDLGVPLAELELLLPLCLDESLAAHTRP